MSLFMQRFGRLRNSYPALLRLGSDNGNQPHQVLSAVLKYYKHSTPSAVCTDLSTALGVPSVITPLTKYDSPERIPENTYAHNLFLNSWKYANTVVQPSTVYSHVTNGEALEILEKDWNLMTSIETVSAVKRLSYNICYEEEKIEPLKYTIAFNALKTENLTNTGLMTIMRHLIPFNSHLEKCSFYTNLCIRIDRECIMRFLQLPAEKTLYLCDIMYQMIPKNNQYYSQYVWYSIRNLGNKPFKLSPQQLVQLLFFLNIYRKPPINMYEIEFQLEQYKDELSINELAIAALGFFKTSTKIRSKDFLNYIVERTIAEIDMVDSVSIGGIIKLVRYSMSLTETKLFIELLNVLTPYVPRYTLMSLAHITQACGRAAIYNKKLMDRIGERLTSEIKIARLKDLERFLYSFSLLNIDWNDSVYQNIIQELRATWDTTRALEIEKFPQVAARILGYLTIQNVYPMDLIERVMAPDYVNKTCHGNYHFLTREYLVLDYSLRVERPEYDGPFLKPYVRNHLEKKCYDLHLKTGASSTTRANIFFTEVLATCQELFNTTTDISLIRPLPYFTSQDIIFCLDERDQLVPSEKYFSQFELDDIKYVDKANLNNIRWIALIIGHSGLLVRNCRNRPTGALAAKIRQLSIIGYTPIMISQGSWDACKLQQEKRYYIKQLILG